MGYSGSGKTQFITNAIKLLKKKLNYEVSVIKNIKDHPVDEKGKDSYRFAKAGAIFSVIQNANYETAIFMKIEEGKLEELLNWLNSGLIKPDLIFTEGFRNLKNPTVLCVSDLGEIEEQLTENVKMISGIICSKEISKKTAFNIPMIDIEVEFSKFLNLFNLFPKRS
ncbi:MAG: molybdopterin-guanine dinucleotide biosynthesis protein B [Candidatus Hermodarchaeota archaeon]